MPLSAPKGDEEEDDFIKRCMSDDTMEEDYEDTDQRLAVCHSQWEGKSTEGDMLKGKALTHNSTLEEGEPKWGDLDKTKLPRNAHADTGEADKKSTWKYPHHWVKDGGDLDDDGIFTSGKMYLHEGGLKAAWSAAQGARTGQEASDAVKSHLNAHRKAIGLEEEGKRMKEQLRFKTGLSYSEASQQLNAQVQEKLGVSNDSETEWVYIREFYITPKKGIAEHHTRESGVSTLYQFSYKLIDEDKIEIDGDLEEVEETFVPVGKTVVKFSRDGTFIVNGKAEEAETKTETEPKSKKKNDTEPEPKSEDGKTEKGEKSEEGDSNPEIDKDARRVSSPKDATGLMAKAKAKKNDPGFVQGHAAVWDNVDLGGEIMRKGAFTKNLSDHPVSGGKVKLMVRHFAHGGDVLECIGTVTEAKEDDTGLWFNAVFSKVEMAQTVRTLILEGHVDSCSVGYMPVKWNWLTVPAMDDDGSKTIQVLEHLECKLFEVTITVVPMNVKAELTAAKSLTEVASKVKDIAKELNIPEGEALSNEQRAAILDGAFSGEAEAKALNESVTSLGAVLDRLLSKSEPEDTSSKRNEAALRQRKLKLGKARLAMLNADS